jgi:hypothetical protein
MIYHLTKNNVCISGVNGDFGPRAYISAAGQNRLLHANIYCGLCVVELFHICENYYLIIILIDIKICNRRGEKKY